MAWIEVHDTLREHHKTYAFADSLKIPQYSAVGILVSLWTWAINNAPDGDLSKYAPPAIARACYWDKKPEKLIEALTECGWLSEELSLHDWQDYAGRLIDRREANARRNREARERANAERAKKSASRDVAKTKKPKVDQQVGDASCDAHVSENDASCDDHVCITDTSCVHHERIMCASRDGHVMGLPYLTKPNLTVPIGVVANSNLDKGMDQEATTTTDGEDRSDDPLRPPTEEEIIAHQELYTRIENKAMDYKLAVGVGPMEKALRLVNLFGEEWVIKAIERSGSRNNQNWGVVQGILRSWRDKGGIDAEEPVKEIVPDNRLPVENY